VVFRNHDRRVFGLEAKDRAKLAFVLKLDGAGV
jgi:hypothetical protein